MSRDSSSVFISASQHGMYPRDLLSGWLLTDQYKSRLCNVLFFLLKRTVDKHQGYDYERNCGLLQPQTERRELLVRGRLVQVFEGKNRKTRKGLGQRF